MEGSIARFSAIIDSSRNDSPMRSTTESSQARSSSFTGFSIVDATRSTSEDHLEVDAHQSLEAMPVKTQAPTGQADGE